MFFLLKHVVVQPGNKYQTHLIGAYKITGSNSDEGLKFDVQEIITAIRV